MGVNWESWKGPQPAFLSAGKGSPEGFMEVKALTALPQRKLIFKIQLLIFVITAMGRHQGGGTLYTIFSFCFPLHQRDLETSPRS